MARAELELQSIRQLLKQAAVSYKASIWIFLAIALLSSSFETAIDRATDLSGFSLNISNTTFLVDFHFRAKSFSQFHSEDKANEVKHMEVDSLLARFLSALFAYTPTTNGTAQELARSEQKHGLKHTESQQFGDTEGGDQSIQSDGGKFKQTNELEKAQNEKPSESEGTNHESPSELEKTQNEKPNGSEASKYEEPNELETIDKLPNETEGAHFEKLVPNEKPNESERIKYEEPYELETIDKIPNESEDAQFEKLIQLEKLSENKDRDISGITHKGKHSQLETAYKRSPIESGSTRNESLSELKNEVGNAPDADDKTVEDGDEIVHTPMIGSLKIAHRFGNETKKNIGQRPRKQQTRTSSTAGMFDLGAMPPGAERTLILVLSIILLVSLIILIVVTFQGAVVLGVVAFAVTSTHMGKKASIKQSLISSLRSGIWRLMWFVILLGFLQELQTQFLTKILFGEVVKKDQIEKLVHRLSVMPFSILAPWNDELATGIGMFLRIGAFVSFRYLFDWLIYSTYIVGCWVAIVEREHSGREALNRGWNLVKNMAFQASTIKILEAIFCGRSFSWMLKKVGGQFFSSFTVSLFETYFLVLWLVLYFAARCKENEGERGHFSHQDLEDFLDKLR